MGSSIPECFEELVEFALLHPAVEALHIRGRAIFATKGYVRLRMNLRAQELVEVFVYLVVEEEEVYLKDYSVHWQRADGSLMQRWDNAPHHPELENFPYHTHRSEDVVEATPSLQWEDILRLLKEQVLGG